MRIFPLSGKDEPGHREDLVQSFEDGAGDARCLLLKPPGKVAQKTLCLGSLLEFPGLTQGSANTGVEMPGQAFHDVPALVDLAALDRGISPEAAADRLAQGLRWQALSLVPNRDSCWRHY